MRSEASRPHLDLILKHDHTSDICWKLHLHLFKLPEEEEEEEEHKLEKLSNNSC